MKHVFCQVAHAPPETYGDCVRACIASMMDMEAAEVPHFFETGEGGGLILLREWLRNQGRDVWYTAFTPDFTFEDLMEYMCELNPHQYYMLTNGKHAVVCKGGEKVHDPAWYPTKLEHPAEQWVVGVITI